MSLVNRITYYTLIFEMVAFVLTLIPLSFIPLKHRKALLVNASRGLRNEYIQWIARLMLFLVGTVFVDTIMRLRRLEEEFGEHQEHSHTDNAFADLQRKTKLFYTHRNLYLSMFTLFMILVLYRRVKDIYLHILHEEEKQNLMVQLTGLRREVDTLKTSSGPVDGETIKGVNISAAGSGSGSGSAVGGTVKKVASGEQLRKREVGTKGD